MWYVDIALASLAALVNLPIREGRIARTASALSPQSVNVG